MIRKTSIKLALSAYLSIAGVMSASAASVSWDMPNEYPETSVQGENDKYFSSLLKEKTNGQIKIVHHFGGALGLKSKDQLDAVGDGGVQLANTFIPPLGGIDPIFLISSLPFLSSNAQEAKALFEVAKPHYERVLAKYNQKLLYASPWPSSGLWGKAPLNNKLAVSNLKMRTYDANGTKVFLNAGSAPIQLSWADIVPQLSTGGIDGVLTSIEAGLSASFNDYATHFTAINYDSTTNLVTINLDVWNDLSPDMKLAVSAAAAETEEHVWSNANNVVKDNYEVARGRGVTVIEDVSVDFRDEMKKASQSVIKEWVQRIGPKGEELLTEYHSVIARKSSANK